MKKILTTISLTFVPFVSLAQTPGADAGSMVKFITDIFNKRLIPLMVLLALVYVMYAVVQYIGENEDTKSKEEKKQKIFWGIIGLFVIISVWSLVAIVANTFGIFAGGTLSTA